MVRDPAQPPADVGSPGKEYVLALRNTAKLHETLLERIRKQKPKLAEDVKEAKALRAELGTDGPCPALKRARERKEWQEQAKKINKSSDILMDLQSQCNLDLICAECDLELAQKLLTIAEIARLKRKLQAAGVEY